MLPGLELSPAVIIGYGKELADRVPDSTMKEDAERYSRLQLDGVDGESSDHAHEKEIDVVSWSWGMTQSGSMHVAKGGGAGKANVGDLQRGPNAVLSFPP